MGAKPLYLSCAFVIEEGFPMEKLEAIAAAMEKTAKEAGVKIVAGDTKVAGKGQVDGVFITTTGIGEIQEGVETSGFMAKPGDAVIVSGDIGRHGCTILLADSLFPILLWLLHLCIHTLFLLHGIFHSFLCRRFFNNRLIFLIHSCNFRTFINHQNISALDFRLRFLLNMQLRLFFGMNDHRLVIHLFNVQLLSPASIMKIAPKPNGLSAIHLL